MDASSEPVDHGRLRQALLPPRLDDAGRTVTGHIVYGLALATIATSTVGNLVGHALSAASPRWLYLLAIQVTIGLVALLLVQVRRVTAAAWFLLLASWLALVLAAWTVGGLTAPAIVGQFVVVVVAGLLFGWRTSIVAAAAAVGVVVLMAWAQITGVLPPPSLTHTPWSRATVVASYILLAAVAVSIAMWNRRRASEQMLQRAAERAATEAALAESRAVLSAVVEGTTDAVFIKDRDLRYLFINRAAAEMLQMDRADVIGHDDFDLFPPDQAVAVRAVDEQTMALEEPVSSEEFLSPGKGHGRWQLLTKGPLRAADGTLAGVYGMARDITERKQSEERMRATLDSLLDPHVLLQALRNEDGHIVDFVCTDANEAAIAYMHTTRAGLMGAHVLRLLPTHLDVRLFRLWTEAVDSSYPLIRDDLPVAGPAGTTLRYDIRGVKVGDGVSFTWRDVTERHETDALLHRRAEELDSLQRISRLLASQSDLPAALAEARAEISRLFDAVCVSIRLAPDSGDEGLTAELQAAGVADTLERPAGLDSVATAEALAGDCPGVHDGGHDGDEHVLTMPMVSGSRTIGILVVVRTDSSAAFGARESRVAQPVADALAAAIENERLHRRETRQAADDERQRLARDLHDAVTQSIYAANLIARSLPAIWKQNPEEGLGHLASLRRLVRAALAEMRTLLFELRPATLVDAPLDTLLARLGEALEGHADVTVALTVAPELELSGQPKLVLYRIAQEALSNVGKYAQATSVTLDVREDADGVRMVVSDDGRGFDLAATRPDSMGLRIMRERAEEIGAVVVLDSGPGRGTRVTVSWPHGTSMPPESGGVVAPLSLEGT